MKFIKELLPWQGSRHNMNIKKGPEDDERVWQTYFFLPHPGGFLIFYDTRDTKRRKFMLSSRPAKMFYIILLCYIT